VPELDLNAQDVHVWGVSLDPLPAPRRLPDFLSADERVRAERFRAEGDRRRFILCRGVLRSILSRYLDDDPAALKFRYSPYGKPAFGVGPDQPDLRFSVSHCRHRALYAFALNREVGIDVECVRTDVPADEIAARFFSSHETAAICALRPAERPRAFFRLWTRKEAFLKARGKGLSASLRDFAVSSDGPARLLWTDPDPSEASRWRLEDVCVGADHAAAVAAEGNDWVLRFREWP
jgi:4'-phosphopantetheinyl transferase